MNRLSMLMLLVPVLSFTVAFISNGSFFNFENLGIFCFGVYEDGPMFGLSYSKDSSVVITVEKALLFGRKMKIKMKAKDESVDFSLIYSKAAGLIAIYKTKTLLPMKEETYALYIASRFPMYMLDFRSSLNLLGLKVESIGTTLNDKGFTINMGSYRNISIGSFSVMGRKYFGLSFFGKGGAGVFGLGFEGLDIPSIGFSILTEFNKGVFFGFLEMRKESLGVGAYLRYEIGSARLSIMVGSEGFLLAVHE